MASTNSSHDESGFGFVTIRNVHTGDVADYPLYDIRTVASGIDIADEGPVFENSRYRVSVIISRDVAASEIRLSVNGSDPISTGSKLAENARDAGAGMFLYEIPLDESNDCLFSMTYGFARVEVVVDIDGQEAWHLTTKDIPSLSRDDRQTALVEPMLKELLDSEASKVAGWMFSGSGDELARYSILDASLRGGAPKSLPSIIQLLQSIVSAYDEHLGYFRAHGHARVVKTYAKKPLSAIRRAGSHEALWLARNGETLCETPRETSIQYGGSYYLPSHVETERRTKTFDSYENRLVLGFLEQEVLPCAKSVLSSLSGNESRARALQEKLAPHMREDYSLPAMAIVQHLTEREERFVAQVETLVVKAQWLIRAYREALPGVHSAFSRNPRRTKVFQEMRSYAAIFSLIRQWLSFGDFSLDREALALHVVRLDKLYEYYCLFKMLEWLESHGFDEDATISPAIERAEYTQRSFYSNERRVATLYNLQNGSVRVRLYYQPVIYGDHREEHGISLHRLSRGSHWTPDFLVFVRFGEGRGEYHVIDSKYSKPGLLRGGYPKNGSFTEALSKYRSDIAGEDGGVRVSTVWLLSGRSLSSRIWYAESSAWAARRYSGPLSGIGPLTPNHNCLDVVFGTVYALGNEQVKDVNLKDAETLDATVESELEAVADLEGFSPAISSSESLVSRLYEGYVNKEILFDARWAQSKLGMGHPLLRRKNPLGGKVVFTGRWKP